MNKLRNISKLISPTTALNEVEEFFGADTQKEIIWDCIETCTETGDVNELLQDFPSNTYIILNTTFNFVAEVDYTDFMNYLTNKYKEEE